LFAKGDAMTRYVVKFFKEVLGDNGHEAEICQGECEVDAPNPVEAVECGKRVFCDHGQLTHWSLRADRVSVAETEYPS
jgi:hypothetical protein